MAEDPKKQIDKLENSIDKLEEKFASKLADIKEEIQEVSSQTKERDFWLHNKEEAKISDVKSDVIDVKSDVKEVKTGVISDVQEVKSDVQEVKSDVQEIKSDLEKIERANKTLFKMFAGLHQKLMGRSGWYYRWHLRPYSNKIHWATFFTYLLAIIVLVLINIYYVPQPISHAGAGIAKMLNYQGKLTNTSNIPVADGSYNMKISLYDAEAGGSCLWTWKGACGAVTAVPVTVSNGLFNVLLGDTSYQATNALTLNFNTDTYYLGVTVGADAEMSLRKRIGAVGYAYNSDTLDGIHASATATASYLLPLDASVDFALPDDSKVVFRDAGIYIQSSADGKLLLSSDGAGGDAIILSALSGGIDIDTDSTMTISTTNDELQIATGSQDVVLAGSADGTDALTITAGDILVTNGDFDLSAGDFNVTLDAGDNASFTSNAAATVDVLTVTSNTATDNVDALYVDVNNTGASNANGINIDLDVVTSGLGNGERTIGAYIDVNGLAGDNGNSQVIALLLNSAGSSGGATKGIGYSGTWTYGMDMNSTTFGQAEIRLSHSEAIANTTDDQIKLIGNDGTNNAAIIFDLDGVSAAIPTITAGANDLIAINDNLSIGVDGITTETLSNTGFVLGGDDLFVAGMAGIEGSVYSDTGFVTGASTTYGNGSISQTSSETLTIGTTSANLTVQAATAGDVIISLAGGAGDDFTVDSTVLVVESDDNQVGIGTASPGQKLTVEGTLGILETGDTPTLHTIIQGGDQTGSDITYTLPIAAPGVNGYVLSATTAGVMSWVVQSGGTGDITDVGSMTTGAAFADATADDDWLGLGASDGRIEFDNQATDEVNILAANVGIGTQTPGQKLTIEGTLGILEGGGSPSFHSIFQGGDQGGDITYTLPTAAPASNGYLLSGTTGGVLSWAAQVAASPGKGYIAGLSTNNYQTDSYTKLLLQFNGADTATTFYDSALGNKAITVGGTAQIDTAQFKFGGSSALFDGDSDYLLAPDSNDWYFGTGDFTIDTWARFNALPTAGNVMTIVGSYGNASNYWTLYIANSGGTYYLCFGNIVVGSWTIDFERITTLSTNTWYHLAIIRNGNTWKMFKDGSQIGADYSDADEVTDFGNNLYIGSMINYFNGWLDELRISKGVARWTADFSGSLPSAKYNSSGDEITVSASNIVVEDVGGSLVSLVNPALAMDIMTSGANGLDTGSEAASTWYYIWAIYNGSTTAGLLSTSSTSPTMPGGYTYKSLLGAVYNDSKGDFLRYYQYNGNVRYVSQIQALNNGAQTSYYAVPLGDYGVPAIATEALINAKVEPQTSSGSYNYTYISADGIHNYTTLISYYYSVGGATSVDTQQFTIPLITSQTIYYYHSFATCYLNLYVDGYTLNIGGSGGGGGSGININGSDVTLSNTANKFGVGTASPAAKLEVEVGSTEALTGILVDQKDLDQIAMQLASSASATATLFDVAANNVSGDLMNLDWDGATAATGNIIGTDIDLTNLTPTNNGANYAYGVSIKAPAANNDSTAYGLYVQGTTWDYGIYNADDTYLVGNVGINTAPSSKLDILNNATGVTSDNYKVFNLATTSATFNTTGGVITNYGAYFSNTSTHTGAPPLTNIGLYVNASGAETNYALVAMGGNVGIGTALPSSLFSVGSLNQFQVNSTGNLIYVNNVNYSWPSSQGAANSVLKNNGSGTLSWSAVPGLGNYSNLKTKNYQTDSYTKLLLQFNGADAATTFYDSSLSNKTITKYNDAQIDTAQSKFGSSSGLFDGNQDYLTLPLSSDWTFGTGDFTIDTQIRFNALPAAGQYQVIIARYHDFAGQVWGWVWTIYNNAGTYESRFANYNNGAETINVTKTISLSTNTWYHLALVRNGNNWMIFQDGVQLGTTVVDADSINSEESMAVYLGISSYDGTSYDFNGWIDEFRISKGVARWTSTPFDAPTAKYNSSGDEIVVTADSLVVADTSNNITELLGVNISTVDIMASGANGLDTGSEAASTWYYIWVIYDGSNIRGLLSTSSSAPSMPGSYTYKRLLGAVYNDSKGDFLRYYQYNGNVRYVSQIQALNNGAQTSYYAVPLGDYGVPAIATEALLQADANYATSGGNIGPVYISMNGVDTYTQLESAYYTTGVFYKDTQQFTIPMPTSQTIYYYVSYSNMRLSIFTQGFTLNL